MKNSFLFLIASVCLVIISCNENEHFVQSLSNYNREFYVSTLQATELIDSLDSSVIFPKEHHQRSRSALARIDTIAPIQDDEGENLFYIINLNVGGWFVLSADKRIRPILAYSKTGVFRLGNDVQYPIGLVQWLIERRDQVISTRKMNAIQTSDIAKMWLASSINNLLNSDIYTDISTDKGRIEPPPSGCEESWREVGPLITTNWDQDGFYNDQAPFFVMVDNYTYQYVDIDEIEENMEILCQTLAGCVAVATAQVMNYHRFPDAYDWNIMTNELSQTGQEEIARLIKDVGDAVDMDWGCDASGTDTENAAGALRNGFGYQSAQYVDFNVETVKLEINGGNPVILRGGTKEWWLFIPYDGGGHAWVCDGFREWISSETCNTYVWLNMNWGWGIDAINGWYDYNDWSPIDKDYNYNKSMIANIRP